MGKAKRKKLLVVDDHEVALYGMKNLLSDSLEDWDVLAASSGVEGLTLTTKERPDLVVLDIDMPFMDGFTVLDKIRERGIATRVVMLSGHYTETKHIIRCIKGGACDYMTKPLIISDLVRRIPVWMETEGTINLNVKTSTNSVEVLLEDLERKSRKSTISNVNLL